MSPLSENIHYFSSKTLYPRNLSPPKGGTSNGNIIEKYPELQELIILWL
jgi:hypothetical protein